MAAPLDRGTRVIRTFWLKVQKSTDLDDCWPWLGLTNDRGYGRLSVKRTDGSRQEARAHRIAYELTHGREPVEIDHLCRNRACCNPAHLEDVDHRVNMTRARPFMGANAAGGGVEEYRVPAGVRYRIRWRFRDAETGRALHKSKTFQTREEAEDYGRLIREQGFPEWAA